MFIINVMMIMPHVDHQEDHDHDHDYGDNDLNNDHKTNCNNHFHLTNYFPHNNFNSNLASPSLSWETLSSSCLVSFRIEFRFRFTYS